MTKKKWVYTEITIDICLRNKIELKLIRFFSVVLIVLNIFSNNRSLQAIKAVNRKNQIILEFSGLNFHLLNAATIHFFLVTVRFLILTNFQ